MTAIDILLIEDNPNDAEMTVSALTEHNYSPVVHVLKDGAEALDFLFGSKGCAERGPAMYPKVVLLDLKLPKVNGQEILRQIKSDERTRHIPVVALTSSNEERDRIECYDLGVNSYVVKPVDFDNYSRSVGNIGRYWIRCNTPAY